MDVKSENGRVSCQTAEGTVLHININQRSAGDCLLDALRFFRDVKKSGGKTGPSPISGAAANLGFGAAYCSLGLVSVMFAVIVRILQWNLNMFYTGLHFWFGFSFIVSGALHLMAYKSPKTFWKGLVFISLLLNLGESIAGIVLTADDTVRINWNFNNGVCDKLRYGRNDYYGATRSSGYYYESDYDLRSCREHIQRYQILANALVYMTLLLMIWGLCLSILSLGYRVKSFCSSCKVGKTEVEEEALINPIAYDNVIIA